MNYPLNDLTVITPIIFFVLLFAFPVIGVFGGWKRAAYWGGGNFINYITGLIIWRTAGFAISNNFIPLVKGLLPSSAQSADIATLVNSMVSPIFFLIVLLISNIALVICYYTFAKKLIGIGKYDKDKYPQANQQPQAKGGQVKVQTKTGNVKIYNKKWFNMVVGGVGLTALMLPITLSTTHAVAMTTTSVDTRKTNGVASGLYGGLQETSGTWHWFSFYTGKRAGNDYNFLFSSLAVSNKKVTIDGKEYTGTEAVTDVLPKSAEEFANEVNAIGTIDSQIELDIAGAAADAFIEDINTIVTGLGTDNISAMISSDGGQELISSLLPGGNVTIDETTLREQISDPTSVTNMIKKGVENESGGKYHIETKDSEGETISTDVTAIKETVPIDQSSYDKLLDTAVQMYKVEGTVSDPVQLEKDKKEMADALLKMIFVVK